MITPVEIQNKQFNKSFRGYKQVEVDQFLDEIIYDYEKLYKENIELKDKILMLNEQIKHYNNLEETLKDTLIVAQNTADEVTQAARQKSEIIIDDAEIMAKRIISDANKEVKDIKEQYEYFQKEIFIFKTRYRSFIESQLMTIDDFYSQIESKYIDNDIGKNSKEYIDEEDLDSKEMKLNEKIDDLGA